MRRLAIDVQRLRELWLADVPVVQIAAQLGCSPSLASKRAHAMGLAQRVCNTSTLPQAEIVRVYVDHGLSMWQIAEQLRQRFPTISETTVKRVLLQRGVALRPRGGPPLDRVADCVRLSRAGHEAPVIAKRLGLTYAQVMIRLHRAGVFVGRGRRARLPVAAIVSCAAAGETYAQIAKRYGCTSSAVGIHVRAARKRRSAS